MGIVKTGENCQHAEVKRLITLARGLLEQPVDGLVIAYLDLAVTALDDRKADSAIMAPAIGRD